MGAIMFNLSTVTNDTTKTKAQAAQNFQPPTAEGVPRNELPTGQGQLSRSHPSSPVMDASRVQCVTRKETFADMSEAASTGSATSATEGKSKVEVPPKGLPKGLAGSVSYVNSSNNNSSSSNNNNCISSSSNNGQNDSLTSVSKKRKKKWTPEPVEDRSIPFMPVRDYYHFGSFAKFKGGDWENDVDSDDEVDNSWLHQLQASQLKSYADIPKKDKELMEMWNTFIRSDNSNVVIQAKSIPQKCLNFVEEQAMEIRDAGLGEHLSWHLVNLCQEGLISSDHLSFCLDHYNKLASGAAILVKEQEGNCGAMS